MTVTRPTASSSVQPNTVPSGDHEYEPEGDDDGGGDVFKVPREYKKGPVWQRRIRP